MKIYKIQQIFFLFFNSFILSRYLRFCLNKSSAISIISLFIMLLPRYCPQTCFRVYLNFNLRAFKVKFKFLRFSYRFINYPKFTIVLIIL